MRVTYIMPAMLTLVGCTTLHPSIPSITPDECVAMGVSVGQNAPMLPVVSATSTTLGGVAKNCGGDGPVTKLGCIKPAEGGYEIFYSGPESEKHEWCHALHGPQHR